MQTRLLNAGPVQALYESASLRYLKIGGRELLRRVFVAVRDSDWRTIPAEISGEKISGGASSFDVAFNAEHRNQEIDFRWHGTIAGSENGTIRWSMEGEAKRGFSRNRIGFCVLHPIDGCAGQPCEVEHVDGSRETSRFPDLISPHQPFLNVRALSHQLGPHLAARVEMQGDVFETEDQRNWSDASFKTYSTPLSIPYPVRLEAGTRIAQTVELKLVGAQEPDAARAPSEGPVTIKVDRSRKYLVPALVPHQDFGFVDLNRQPDLLRWVINPQVHAEDELTMVENLAGQAPMVRSARARFGDKPVQLSVLVPPIRAAAGWTAISLRELAMAGVQGLTYSASSPVLDHVRQAEPTHVFPTSSSAPLRCDALALASGTWLINFAAEQQELVFEENHVQLEPYELRRMPA